MELRPETLEHQRVRMTAALHVSPKVCDHFRLDAAALWLNSVFPLTVNMQGNDSWFLCWFFVLSHLPEHSCRPLPADLRCLSGCTRYWSSAWASHRGEGWPKVKSAHTGLRTHADIDICIDWRWICYLTLPHRFLSNFFFMSLHCLQWLYVS